METLQNITTTEIRRDWHIYKDIVKELELFDLIWYCWFKKNNMYNSSDIETLKDFITLKKREKEYSHFTYNDTVLKINTSNIRNNDINNFVKKMIPLLKNIGLHNEYKIENNNLIIYIYKQESWKWEYSEKNPYHEINKETYRNFIERKDGRQRK